MSALAVVPADAPDHGAIANLCAEASLIGAMLIENSLIDQVADLVQAEDFLFRGHAKLFAAIVRERSMGRNCNPVTLYPEFKDDPDLATVGGVGFLSRLTSDGGGLLGPRDLANQVSELAARRRLFEAMTDIRERLVVGLEPLADLVAETEASLVTRRADEIHQPTAGECLTDLVANFGQNGGGVECKAIPSLDKLLGPLKPGQLVITAARPGMGKTAVALSYAIGAAKAGHGVLFVSLEMSARELSTRMAADLCFNYGDGIPFAAINAERLNDHDLRRVRDAASRAHGLPLHIVDAGSLAVERLALIVRRHQRRFEARGFKLELVIVDYLQLLRTQHRGKSIYETITEISKALKGIAKDSGVSVMALAQLSREVEKRPDKHPQLADLRDSGQIEQDADMVLFLLREEYYLRQIEPDKESPAHSAWQDKLDLAKGQIKFILAKKRNGTTGTATGEFHGSYQAVRG